MDKKREIFAEYESRVLQKYKDWKRIDVADRPHDFNFDEMYLLAKITDLARELL